MSQHFQHRGGGLPITLTLDQTEIDVQCPTCERLEYEGTITLKVAAERQSGSTPATCSRGHMTFVHWSRDDASGSESPGD